MKAFINKTSYNVIMQLSGLKGVGFYNGNLISSMGPMSQKLYKVMGFNKIDRTDDETKKDKDKDKEKDKSKDKEKLKEKIKEISNLKEASDSKDLKDSIKNPKKKKSEEINSFNYSSNTIDSNTKPTNSAINLSSTNSSSNSNYPNFNESNYPNYSNYQDPSEPEQLESGNKDNNNNSGTGSIPDAKIPLIYFNQPMVPFSQITINNPNKNDLFFGLILKYGKLKVQDEDTTIIQDITLFHEKDETMKMKGNTKENVLATECRIEYKKKKLIVTALDTVYKIKTFKPGKYKFFNESEAQKHKTLLPMLSFDSPIEIQKTKDCVNQTISLFKNIVDSISTINKSLDLDDNYLGENETTFNNFVYDDIKRSCSFFSSIDPLDLEQDTIKKLFSDLYLYTSFFTLKVHIYTSLVFSSSELDKILNLSPLMDKLTLINTLLSKTSYLINLKYNQYQFPKLFRLNTVNPFRNQTPEDLSLIVKFKETVDSKISEIDSIDKEKDKISQKLSKIRNIPPEVRKTVEGELDKISSVNYESENAKRFEYLNHVISLPWDRKDPPLWDLDYAKKVLDDNLYGLEETKQRIYEFIAKNIRVKNERGCVLLLSGGPGVGKTRIAKLIGEALKREVGFISLAGVSDGKSILGFKRTYISSTPGLFIREMQKVNTMNPVIVVDEIDKINVKYGYSNVYNALLQLMNPEENNRFVDHYLEIPFDFSNVIFILTSNNYDLFAPLIDRMEVIKVEPYVYYEKFLIAKNYSLKQLTTEYKLNNLEITDKALYEMIFTYCKHEAGVRRLKKLLETIIRKITAKIELTEGSETNLNYQPLQINSSNIFKYIDEPNIEDKVLSDMITFKHKHLSYGNCIGLFVSRTDQLNSWGDASVFSITLQDKQSKVKLSKLLSMKDSSKKPHKEEVKFSKLKQLKYEIVCTGNLGEDSIQSLNIALDLASEHLLKIDKKKYANYFFDKIIRYDCPQILQPKSGPSAGVVAYLTAMSAALKRPVIKDIAMTGEVAIDGSVLKIGGVKEKCQGAQRYGVNILVLPIGNKGDFFELQSNLRNSFSRVFFAKTVTEVYEIGFGGNTIGIDCYIGEPNNQVIMTEVILKDNPLDRLI